MRWYALLLHALRCALASRPDVGVRCGLQVTDTIKRLIEQYRRTSLTILLPLEDDDLLKQSGPFEDRAKQSFDREHGQLTDIPAVHELFSTKLLPGLENERERLFERNMARVKELCQPVFDCAMRTLAYDRTCTLCLSRVLRMYYESRARSAAALSLCQEEQHERVRFSARLKQRTIDHWIRTDLAAATHNDVSTMSQRCLPV